MPVSSPVPAARPGTPTRITRRYYLSANGERLTTITETLAPDGLTVEVVDRSGGRLVYRHPGAVRVE